MAADEEDAVFAGLFGAEHESSIGELDEFFGGGGVVGENGDAAADGEGSLSGGAEAFELVFGEEFGEAIEDHFGSLGGSEWLTCMAISGFLGLSWFLLFPEDDGEFVAAESGDEVVFATAASHESGGAFEDFVADAMAVAVVIFFEVVDIEDKEGDREEFFFGAFEDSGEEMAEVASVVEAGEFVGDGEFLESGVTFLEGQELAEEVGKSGDEMSGGDIVLVRWEEEVQRAAFFTGRPDGMGDDGAAIGGGRRRFVGGQVEEEHGASELLIDGLDGGGGRVVRVVVEGGDEDFGERQVVEGEGARG